VSQASKRLRESDMIQQKYNALARTLQHEKTAFVKTEDLDMLEQT